MPKYVYNAKALSPVRILRGEIEAETKQQAINALSQMGHFPISVELLDIGSYRKNFWHLRKVSNKEMVLFTRQLSILLESGVNILQSLNMVSKQSSNGYLKMVLEDVVSKVKDGKPLSDSLASHPSVFSSLYSSMIATGEAGGNLAKTLNQLADFSEKNEEFKDSVRAALTYPVFVLCVGILTITILLVFVIPRLVNMFSDMGQVLPLPTRILIMISDALRNSWWIIIIFIFLGIFLGRRAYLKPNGKFLWDGFKLKIPFYGQITLKTEISRLMRTFSLLLSSGITLVPSMDISSSVLGNQVLKIEVQNLKEDISKGSNLSAVFKKSKFFPEFVTNIVAIGEETGALEKSLSRIAEEYEKDVDRSLKTLAQMLEPMIILGVGLVVGFIVLSMLLPIFQLNLIVK